MKCPSFLSLRVHQSRESLFFFSLIFFKSSNIFFKWKSLLSFSLTTWFGSNYIEWHELKRVSKLNHYFEFLVKTKLIHTRNYNGVSFLSIAQQNIINLWIKIEYYNLYFRYCKIQSFWLLPHSWYENDGEFPSLFSRKNISSLSHHLY